MIAIIPCAGRGTRRKPDTNCMPKILIEHHGEPLFEHVVRPIDMSERFEKLVFVLSPRTGNQIIDYVRRNPLETPVKFVWQNEPLGFGHAVLQAREEVFSWKRRNPPILVHTDDSVNSHLREGASLIKQITSKETSTLGTQWRESVRDYGMVVVGESEEAGKRWSEGARKRGSEEAREKPDYLPRANSPVRLEIERLIEKPYWDKGGLCMTGIYFIRESRRLFRCLKTLVKIGRRLGGEYEFTHALQMMVDQGTPFRTCYHEWVDAGKQENEK